MSVSESFKDLPLATFRSFFPIGPILFLAFGLYVFVLIVMDIRQENILQTSGVVVEGIVSDLKRESDYDGNISYAVFYQFEVPTNQSALEAFSGLSYVNREIYESLEVGEKISIIYEENDPGISRFEGEEGGFNLWDYVGLVISLMIGWQGVAELWKIRVAHELSTNGVLAKGEVDAMWTEEHANKVGTDTHYISYSFGQGFSGREVVEKQVYDRLHVGDSVTIRYLIRDAKIFRMEIE